MSIHFRKAEKSDVPGIVQLLSDDELGKLREDFRDPLPEVYYTAFENISKDYNQELTVVENEKGELIGTLQLSFIPYLTYQGGWRALIEGVRVHGEFRGLGIGQRLFEWGIERARKRGCHLVQLTTDKSRPDALRFYEGLGFKASHEGLKLFLEQNVAESSGKS